MYPVSWPFQRLITTPPGQQGRGITYILRDDFTDTRAAGAVNGTPATPGPAPGSGKRNVTDTGAVYPVASDKIEATGGGSGVNDPQLWYDSISRVAGMIVLFNATQSTFGNQTNSATFGLQADPTDAWTDSTGFYLSSAGLLRVILIGSGADVGTHVSGTYSDYIIVVRSSGAYFFQKSGAVWKLLYVSDTGNDATLYISSVTRALNYSPVNFDSIRFLNPSRHTFLPTPHAYDTFTRAMVGSTETAGPDGQTTLAIAWVQQSGSWEISGNQLQTAAAGAGIATLATGGNGDFVISADITTPAAGTTPAGLVVRFTDTNNYWYLKMTPSTAGTDFELVEVNAGVPTTRASADIDWVAATQYTIKCNVEGSDEWRIFVDDVAKITYTTSNTFNQTAAGVGFRDEGNQNFKFDNLLVLPRGTGGEYSELDKY